MDALWIGGWAADKLHPALQEARVWGVTSRGVFLHLESNWIVFLSYEPFRGPLTINLPAEGRRLSRLSAGAPVRGYQGGLKFPTLGEQVAWPDAPRWQAPPLPQTRLDFTALQGRLAGMQHHAELAFSLPACLGLGPGLTPAGDDFAAGVLLTFSRWGETIRRASRHPASPLAWTSSDLVSLAYRRTTTLSANLIECAAQGQADERLVAALDALLAGQPPVDQALERLLGWGSSSGRAAWGGILWAVQWLSKLPLS
jgi:hypothetical protein